MITKISDYQKRKKSKKGEVADFPKQKDASSASYIETITINQAIAMIEKGIDTANDILIKAHRKIFEILNREKNLTKNQAYDLYFLADLISESERERGLRPDLIKQYKHFIKKFSHTGELYAQLLSIMLDVGTARDIIQEENEYLRSINQAIEKQRIQTNRDIIQTYYAETAKILMSVDSRLARLFWDQDDDIFKYFENTRINSLLQKANQYIASLSEEEQDRLFRKYKNIKNIFAFIEQM
jgi:cellobiose-specific phosphotransferase system component IIA